MKELIDRFAHNPNSNGLMVVATPTGSHKSTQAEEFIVDFVTDKANKNRKVVFVTTLKKNLPEDDLRDMFRRRGILDLFDKTVINIKSNSDSVIENWPDDMDDLVPSAIKKTPEYKTTKSLVEYIKNDQKFADRKEWVTREREEFRLRVEPEFRHMIERKLKEISDKANDRLQLVLVNPEWQWVGMLYPAVFTKKRQVFLMSMDKFLNRNSTIVESSYPFISEGFLKNAVVIIDEFDATKDTILKWIIDNGIKNKCNIVELFEAILGKLVLRKFPETLTKPSPTLTEEQRNNFNIEEHLNYLRDEATKIYEDCSLTYMYKTSDKYNKNNNLENFIFEDHRVQTIVKSDSVRLGRGKKYLVVDSDKRNRINAITLSDKVPGPHDSVRYHISHIRRFIHFFMGAVPRYADNYMSRKRAEGQEIDRESSIRSVLKSFGVVGEYNNYLTDAILYTRPGGKRRNQSSNYEISFYDRGFRCYSFIDDIHDDIQSQLNMCEFYLTPELVISNIASIAKVVGMSATANLNGVLGNYDLTYLEDKLGDCYVHIPAEELARLEAKFEANQAGYKDISIYAELIDSEEYSGESWKQIFDNEELAEEVYLELRRLLPEDRKEYFHKRYYRICKAFKEFASHEDIYSFLCILTKHPKEKDSQLDKAVLEKYFGLIAKAQGWNNYSNDCIQYLIGDDYDIKKTEIASRLSSGEKLFVISTYQTIGAGQNLQYKAPDRIRDKLIRINDYLYNDKKDFDAIYLDKPTNLLVNLGDNLSEQDYIKYIFQMEYLLENGEISLRENKDNIAKAFNTYSQGKRVFNRTNTDFSSKRSVLLLCLRYIIQATGRMCRTNLKNPNIYIYADSKISDCIDVEAARGQMLNKEFAALLDVIDTRSTRTPEQISYANRIAIVSSKANSYIRNFLGSYWSDARIARWHSIRENVLKYPTASPETAKENDLVRCFYGVLPEPDNKLYYSQEYDYGEVDVSFVRDNDHKICLDAEGSKLYDFLLIPGVRDLFISNGWATDFIPNEYILSPSLWNNVYKGALGEVVGKYLFEELIGVPMEEIVDNTKHEKFDYKIKDTDIYVDFKNWHEGVTCETEEARKHIVDKAKSVGSKCVIIANILSTTRWARKINYIDGIKVIEIPYLVLKENDHIIYDPGVINVIRRAVDEFKN